MPLKMFNSSMGSGEKLGVYCIYYISWICFFLKSKMLGVRKVYFYVIDALSDKISTIESVWFENEQLSHCVSIITFQWWNE